MTDGPPLDGLRVSIMPQFIRPRSRTKVLIGANSEVEVTVAPVVVPVTCSRALTIKLVSAVNFL